MHKLFKEVKDHQSAFITLVRVNIKTTVATTRLGWLWWIINPLIMMAIYYFFVNVLLERGGAGYHLFVLTGLVAWYFFNRSVVEATKVIFNNKQLICQVALPISILVAIPVLVQFFFASIGIIIVMVWSYGTAGFHSLAVVPLMLLIAMVSYGLGLFVSVVNVYVKDTKEIISYALRAGFFLSPILYPTSRVLDSERIPDLAKMIYHCNPMAWIISALRQVLLEETLFNGREFFFLFLISFLLVQAGLFWLRAHSSQIVKML